MLALAFQPGAPEHEGVDVAVVVVVRLFEVETELGPRTGGTPVHTHPRPWKHSKSFKASSTFLCEMPGERWARARQHLLKRGCPTPCATLVLK